MKANKTSIITPLDICVLIPCYNNKAGLLKSLESIKYHQHKLCAVVIDDGSPIPVKLEEMPDPGICGFSTHVVRIEKNKGITNALNVGLQWIKQNLSVQYIARLDCADLCHPSRFYRQAEFLNKNSQIGLLGSWCVFRDPSSDFEYTYTTPTDHHTILSEMHFRNVFIHPTVLFRSELLEKVGVYPADYPYVEDYALFFKMLHKTKGAILGEFLVTCEINAKGLSITNRKDQLRGRERVVSEFGSSTFLKFIAKQKLRVLRILPYNIVLIVKNRLSKSNL
ncbi:glycosyltransferase [Rufibacter tibetensis]|uniref:glycosyltransferase n=1 Tax=Rufibacter tibetensis TaxID=512763 RepID=UPI000783F1BC|nr:glycosyltransferase [Rufibacter tibetensis]